jgi:hypothetical protein
VAKIDNVEHIHDWTKTGLMMRDTTVADSGSAAVFVTPENRACFQYHFMVGQNAITIHTNGKAVTLRHWIRLVRDGNKFKAQHSNDGNKWKGTTPSPTTTVRTSAIQCDD